MTDLKITPRQGKPVELARFQQEVDPTDRLAITLAAREWCKRDGRWKLGEIRLEAWSQRKGWIPWVFD